MKPIPLTDLMEAIEENNSAACTNWGFCLSCGSQQDGCEPDARRYKCDDCGNRSVYGSEEILMMGAYTE